jgi:hypothetical protein
LRCLHLWMSKLRSQFIIWIICTLVGSWITHGSNS